MKRIPRHGNTASSRFESGCRTWEWKKNKKQGGIRQSLRRKTKWKLCRRYLPLHINGIPYVAPLGCSNAYVKWNSFQCNSSFWSTRQHTYDFTTSNFMVFSRCVTVPLGKLRLLVTEVNVVELFPSSRYVFWLRRCVLRKLELYAQVRFPGDFSTQSHYHCTVVYRRTQATHNIHI